MLARDPSKGLRPPGEEHAGIYDRLPEYVMQLLEGRLPGDQLSAEWQEVRDHLKICEECRSEVEELRSIIQETAAGTLAPAPGYPQPDLSFLNSLPAQIKATSPPLREVADHLLALVRSVVIELDPVRLGLAPQPAFATLAGSFRSGKDTALSQNWRYQHPADEKSALGITIDAGMTDPERKLCRVLITVDDARDPLPQQESEVTLQYGAIAQTAATDMGLIAFADVPLETLNRLRVTVTKQPPKK